MSASAVEGAAKPKKQSRTERDDVDLRVVPVRRRIGFATAGGVTLLLFLLLGMVAFQAFIVRNQSVLDDLDSQLEQARRDHELLRFQVAELESPDRIRSVAIDGLGMEQPESVVYLPPISAGELVTEAEPVAPVDKAKSSESPTAGSQEVEGAG